MDTGEPVEEQHLPCPSTIMRNVPRSLNWTGGMSERSSVFILSVTPSSNIRTLLVAEIHNSCEDHVLPKPSQQLPVQVFLVTTLPECFYSATLAGSHVASAFIPTK